MPDNEEPKFKKYLYNEVTLVVAIAAFLWGVFNFINNPQKQFEADLKQHEALQQQHEKSDEEFQQVIVTQLEAIRTGDFKDFKADLLENRDLIVLMQKDIVKLETIINERIPAKK